MLISRVVATTTTALLTRSARRNHCPVDEVMEVGMVFTIEPMLTLGSQDWEQWDDGWTVVTKDRSRTAQFEHTLVVTETGAEVLTLA